MIDLSALEIINTTPGAPLLLDITKVIEDPNQPRQEFPEKELQELADDIRERGVKSPVSIKPINADGLYVLNAGARRRRAAIIAGLSKLPAFIDHDFTDYDQVNENEQRKNLTPMEIALFIKKRIDNGDKKVDIARKLRRDKSSITHHQAMINLPDCLNNLYRSGRCISAFNLYELRKLHDKAPSVIEDAVITWCSNNTEITREIINGLKIAISGDTTETESDLCLIEDQIDSPFQAEQSNNDGEMALKPKEVETEQSNKIRKPVILVKHEEKSAVIILDRHPEKENHILIRYDGAASELQEVPCQSVRLVGIADAK
jgi:ParB family transcriptional regulator, chromosome partitioning protein